jgi:starch synthase
VSPTYAREILTRSPASASRACLAAAPADLVGILNGIDTERWNPGDRSVHAAFTADRLDGKREAKRALLRGRRLPVDEADWTGP